MAPLTEALKRPAVIYSDGGSKEFIKTSSDGGSKEFIKTSSDI